MAIPLQQGQVFNMYNPQQYAETLVAIPLKQGQVFNILWHSRLRNYGVTIPVQQGQVFNRDAFWIWPAPIVTIPL